MIMKKTYATVIGVVIFEGKILLLKRTDNRHSSPNKWQPVSGFIGEREAAEDAVLREVKEETGLKGKIIKVGKVFEVSDNWGRWVIMPFLVSVETDRVKIDKTEHSEYKWVKPKEIKHFDCVAGVKEDLEAVGLL
jgi:8-oxo-dGTP diphosphatase